MRVEGLLMLRPVEALRHKPFPVLDAPGPGFAEHTSLTQQELPQTIACPQPVHQGVLPAADQVTGPLPAPRGDMDGRQFSRAVELGQLFRVPPVSLDPVAGPHGDQPRSDDHATVAHLREMSLHGVPARTRFVDEISGSFLGQTADKLLHRLRLVLDLDGFRRAVRCGRQDRRHDGILVHVQAYDCDTIVHELVPPCSVWIGSPRSNPRYTELMGYRLVHSIYNPCTRKCS